MTGVGYTTIQVRRKIDEDSYCPWETLSRFKPNLLTNNGRDLFHQQCYTNTSAGTRGTGFIALSQSSTAPATSDTAVASEETTGGMTRVDAVTKTHTAGTNSTLIEHTFTASATFSTLQLSGLFNAVSGVTLTHENTFSSTALVSGDQLKVSWTLNLG